MGVAFQKLFRILKCYLNMQQSLDIKDSIASVLIMKYLSAQFNPYKFQLIWDWMPPKFGKFKFPASRLREVWCWRRTIIWLAVSLKSFSANYFNTNLLCDCSQFIIMRQLVSKSVDVGYHRIQRNVFEAAIFKVIEK